MLAANRSGFFPYTPSTSLIHGLEILADSGLLAALDVLSGPTGTMAEP